MLSRHFQPKHRHRYRYSTTGILAILALFFPTDLVQAAHPRSAGARRVSRSAYDRVISEFNPEGRLEQVEYSAHAATRNIIAVIHDNRHIVVVAPTGSRLELIITSTDVDSINNTPTTASTSTSDADHVCWMIGTGIAGDVLWLRDNLRRLAIQNAIEWDNTTVLVGRLVQELAEICHRLTFVPGARPLGAAAMILSWEKNTPGLTEVSGWNGALAHSEFACLGPNHDAIRSLLQRRRNDRKEPLSIMVTGLVDVAQQVLGKKEPLDVWVLNETGGLRQYKNIRDRRSRRRLEEWIREAATEDADS